MEKVATKDDSEEDLMDVAATEEKLMEDTEAK